MTKAELLSWDYYLIRKICVLCILSRRKNSYTRIYESIEFRSFSLA